MSSALSIDLRQRVVHAVENGASRHQAAERFGVSLASASRWCGQFAREGHVAPKPMGGDQRPHRIEAHAGLIVSLTKRSPAFTFMSYRPALPSTASAWHRAVSRTSSSAMASREKKHRSRGRAGPAGREGCAPDVV